MPVKVEPKIFLVRYTLISFLYLRFLIQLHTSHSSFEIHKIYILKREQKHIHKNKKQEIFL
jgi:hypothetical protein